MIAYLKGKLVSKNPTFLYIEPSNGIAFEVLISLTTHNAISALDECTLYTYLHVKKDGQAVGGFEIYGFFDLNEKQIFEQLISVSGIGTNTARVMLSSMSPSEIQTAIVTENERAISSIKGIGPKTAKRAILELKDKMLKNTEIPNLDLTANNNIKEDALIALVSLGFNKGVVLKALNTIKSTNNEELSVEYYIKNALKVL